MPDWPETAKFLTEEERAFVKERLGPFTPSSTDEKFNKKEFFAVLKSASFWLFSLTYFFVSSLLFPAPSLGVLISRCLQLTNSLNATGYFIPTLLSAMGYKGYKSQLMSVPPALVGFVGQYRVLSPPSFGRLTLDLWSQSSLPTRGTRIAPRSARSTSSAESLSSASATCSSRS